MQIEIGQVVNLKSGLSIKVVGECDVNIDGRGSHYLIGKLAAPKYIHEDTLTKFHLFDIMDIVGNECDDIKEPDT